MNAAWFVLDPFSIVAGPFFDFASCESVKDAIGADAWCSAEVTA